MEKYFKSTILVICEHPFLEKLSKVFLSCLKCSPVCLYIHVFVLFLVLLFILFHARFHVIVMVINDILLLLA